MSRYIDEKEAMEEIEAHSNSDGILDTSLAYVALKNCITADVVEVVRCKDCKKYMTIHCTCDDCCISDEWYCADGERKGNE